MDKVKIFCDHSMILREMVANLKPSLSTKILSIKDFVTKLVNPEGCGGGSKCPYGFSIGCHFSQDHAMVTKILDFIHKHPN